MVVRGGILDPLVNTGRGSTVFLRSTTLEKLLKSYDRAYPNHTVCSRLEVIRGWRDAEEWIRRSEALAMGGVQ